MGRGRLRNTSQQLRQAWQVGRNQTYQPFQGFRAFKKLNKPQNGMGKKENYWKCEKTKKSWITELQFENGDNK